MLERLSWKRLALELFLCCIPALILGGVFRSSAVVFIGGSDRSSYLAFLESDAPVVVAVGRPQHDAAAG
ncbi:phosphate regulon sensor protein PhoR [Klebsiella grimontii]|uniref:Phosphate regulon sensor protein PhoR n=1 Tax=Klebsiella grimontii TaxID=2058152 RepID=A0A7H4P975_9ENTR|nr:phosphate regulon sensor protein PhoR [Klebsiella grimontii]